MRKIITYLIPSVLLAIPAIAFAATGNGSQKFPNPFGSGITSIPEFIGAIVNGIILPAGAVIVVVMIIYSGFLFVVAQGNESKISSAKQSFMYAVIGALILLGAWVIANAITGTICSLYEPGSAPSGLGC